MPSWPSVMRAVGAAVQPLYGMRPAAILPPRQDLATPADLYRVLRAYYQSNGLYDVLADVLRRQGVWREGMKPLRNPAYRAVEFYPAHVWPGTLPGALPIMARRKGIVKPIQQVWKWSNWTSKKQVASRHLALYGDWFTKVSTTPADAPQRVFFQILEPEHVTDFDVDERDFLTYVRVEVPQTRRLDDGSSQGYTHTEEWNKGTGRYRTWDHLVGTGVTVDQLGTPTRDESIESFGIDFIPIVHAKFADIGELRGMGALVPALDKIDEANRQATRLAQLLFRHNDVLWALRANAMTGDNRPMPAPRITNTDANPTGAANSDDGTITLGDDRMLALPGTSTLESLVPALNYEAALMVLQDHMRELEHDLPELVSYRLGDDRDLSGRAVRLLLGPAISRLEEARGNAEGALVRADQMALTIGQQHGIFKRLGSYDNGDFEHEFEQRDVLPADDLERSQTQQAQATAMAQYVTAGVPVELAAVEVWGWTPERAAQFTEDRLAAIKREQQLATEDVEDGAEQ